MVCLKDRVNNAFKRRIKERNILRLISMFTVLTTLQIAKVKVNFRVEYKRNFRVGRQCILKRKRFCWTIWTMIVIVYI